MSQIIVLLSEVTMCCVSEKEQENITQEQQTTVVVHIWSKPVNYLVNVSNLLVLFPTGSTSDIQQQGYGLILTKDFPFKMWEIM